MRLRQRHGQTNPAPQDANPVSWLAHSERVFAEVVAAQTQASTTPRTPQGHKDELLKLADTTQQAFMNAARKLTALGPPAILDRFANPAS